MRLCASGYSFTQCEAQEAAGTGDASVQVAAAAARQGRCKNADLAKVSGSAERPAVSQP